MHDFPSQKAVWHIFYKSFNVINNNEARREERDYSGAYREAEQV